jgi:hypothetical protein
MATGLTQWLKWGTTAPPGTAVGILKAGGFDEDPQVRTRLGVGGLRLRVGGLMKWTPSATYYLTNTNLALFNASFRASYPRGALTPVVLAGGNADDGTQYSWCYVTEATLDYQAEEGVTVSQTFVSIYRTTVDGSTMVTEANLDFEDYQCTATIPGGSSGVTSASIRVQNTVTPWTAGDAKSSGYERWPLGLDQGIEDVTVSFNCRNRMDEATLGLEDDVMPKDLDFVLTFSNGTDTLTIEGTDFICTKKGEPFKLPDEAQEYTYEFTVAGSEAAAIEASIA